MQGRGKNYEDCQRSHGTLSSPALSALMAGDAVVTAVCMSHIQSPSHHHNHRCHFHHHHRCHHHCRFCHCHWPHHITPLNVFSSSMTSSTPSKWSHLCWNSGHSAADIATSILLSTTELSEGQKTSVSERNSPNPKIWKSKNLKNPKICMSYLAAWPLWGE